MMKKWIETLDKRYLVLYFSEGPYIELLKDGGMSALARKIMRLMGKGEFMERFDYWANTFRRDLKEIRVCREITG
ncbi:hypothetical protein SAMN05216391_102102 [Lachnospiraceae bacterium KHCPX20]|nr:hypothetical protein SAMN05216391_102102 [Lachnospiraceae bacterium KHCPX20]